MNIRVYLRDIKSKISCYLNAPFLYGNISYSQEGEDLIIEKCFHKKSTGYFLDIGAYHPYKYSNTYKLYKKGWNGINIDASNESVKLFNLARKRDRNIHAAVGAKSGYKYFYTFEDPVFNTFINKNKNEVVASKQSVFKNKYKVKIIGINNILNKYIKEKGVDFLNIDTEGESYNILRSINYVRFHPDVIAVERENMGKEIENDRTVVFMKKKGYLLVSSTPMTYIFSSIG